ncbi:HAD-like protein [Lichtheimia hyalospora FSU 10163]|nr:HAD-like protein [Lichtheimia hyalospora FSU 10163]
MRHLPLHWLLLSAWMVQTIYAMPQFNEVNGYQLNGTRCPLQTYHAFPCPQLCVRDINDCPVHIRPACPPNQTYCMDGTCRTHCPSNIISKCECRGAPKLQQGAATYPCKPGDTVDIPNFNSTQLASHQACADHLGISSVSNWVPEPIHMMWSHCPKPAYGHVTFTEPIYIGVYAFYGLCIGTLLGWLIYKRLCEKHIIDDYKNANLQHMNQLYTPKEKNPGNNDDGQQAQIMDDEAMLITAYRRDIVGMICLVLYALETTGMVVLLLVMTYDYYNDFLLFRGDKLIQTSTFIGIWYIFVGWFFCLVLFRDRLINFFRIRCSYDKGQYVQVEKDEPAMIFIEHENSIMRWVRWLERTTKHQLGLDVVVKTARLQETKAGARYFVYQCTRYLYNPDTRHFSPYAFNLGQQCNELAKQNHGLTSDEAFRRQEMIGTNFIEVYVPHFMMALLREATSFFYIYQFTILWLFYYYDYWQVAIADTGVIFLSALFKVIVRLRAEKRIKSMAEFTDNINLLRDGEWKTLSTAEMVPGDVFQVESGKVAPCDAVILSGNIVADESSLTGEPLPIRKFPLRMDDHSHYNRMGTGKTSTIFAGTTISQAQRDAIDPNQRVTALVTQTGTATDKGQLVKRILFPTRVSFIFDEQLKIVILILCACALIVLCLAIWMYTRGTTAWFYATFAVAQLVSPLLPAALVVGQSVASGHLRKKKIYCVDLPRILMAGKVQIFCFDKTGTLTKEGLEFYGVQPIGHNEPTQHKDNIKAIAEFGNHCLDMQVAPSLMKMGIATCHAVTTLNDQFIGNPVDIEMFRASGWTLQQRANEDIDKGYIDTIIPAAQSPGDLVTPLHIVKRFEFVHDRMSMSVAVLDTRTNKIHIFVKGAYEKIKDLSNASSLPSNYDSATASLAHQGCYVLAMAHRELDLEAIGGMNYFREWSRDQMEQDINLIGLVIFKNQLKEDTTENIAALKQGATRTVMITGDTALTGVYIAKQCGMVSQGAQVLLGDYDPYQNTVVWKDVDQSPTDEKSTTHLIDNNVHGYMCDNPTTNIELAITGKAFQWLLDNDLIRQYLLNVRVFARMTPNQKVQCVQLHMEHGITAMSGDGGNDCGALRAAHVGIAMSDAEASIVSPFSTSHRSVASCVELLRQGRAALVTSITGYKYLVLYGQIMMMLKIFSFYFAMGMPQYVWIAVDFFITVLLTWAVSQAKAAKNLAPQRPTARLLGPQTLASCIGLVVINWLFLSGAFVMLFKQPWYRCNEFDSSTVDTSKWALLSKYYEPEIASLVCLTQFVNSAAVFNFGDKYRQSWWRNYALVVLWSAYLAIIFYWILADPNPFSCAFQFNCGTKSVIEQLGYNYSSSLPPYDTPLGHNVMPRDFRWKLWGLCVANVVAALLYEKLIVLGPIRNYLARKFPLERQKLKY